MRRERGVVCLVTDRRRLAPSDDAHVRRQRTIELAREAVDAGVDIIQVRERDLDGGELADLAGAIVGVALGSPTTVVVNDRLDVALACGAGGVHLRSDSFAGVDARSIVAPGFLIGRSVHNAADARAHASAVDYLIAGTVYPTPSKPAGWPLLGRPGLSEVVQATQAPVLAIGGITLDRLAEVAATGAAGIAGIGVFLDAEIRMAHVVRTVRAHFAGVQPTANIRLD